MSDEIKRIGNTEFAEDFGRAENITGVSEGLNIGFDEIDIFSDLNSLNNDEFDEEVSIETLEYGEPLDPESLQQSDPILNKIGIDTTGFSDNDRLESMRRINYYMGYRDDVSKYSYNKIYESSMNADSVGTFEEKESLSISQEINMYKRILDNTISQIVSANNSLHSDANNDSLKAELLANIREHNNNFEDEEFNSNAIVTIREMLCEQESLSSKEVFARIVENFPEKTFNYYANSEKYLQSLTYLINIYATSMKKASHYQKMRESTSESITFLFKKDKEELQKLEEENRKNNVTFVKQVIKNDDEFFIRCGCGKNIRTTLVSKMFIYGVNDNFNIDYFPIGIICPTCGKIHIFSENDLADSIALFKIQHSDILKNFIQSSTKNCHVGSFGKYKVALGKLEPALSTGMITDRIDSDMDIANDNPKEVEDDPCNIILQSDKEYFEAIDDFYKQLHNFTKDTLMLRQGMFNIRSGQTILHSYETAKELQVASDELNDEDMEHLKNLRKYSRVTTTTTYGVMAAFVASRVNLDYHKTKNRAIFSLLLSIQSNPVIKAYTALGDLGEMYANLQDLKECLSFSSNALSPGYKSILANILIRYGIEVDVKNYNVEAIWKDANALKDELETKIAKYENNLKELKNILYNMEEALVFTKIVNVNSMMFNEIGYLLSDEEFALYCDKVADRMIITNYSEHMVSWRSNTEKDLSKVQDSRTFRKVCTNFIARAIGEYSMVQNSETFNRNKNIVLNKYYKIAEDTSFLRLTASADIYDALKKCDYSRALKLCHNAKIDASQLGEKCDSLVKNAYRNINEFYDKTKELHSLEDNAFYFVLAGFLLEEIDNSKAYKFDTKHIPKRQNSETIEQYIERVQKTESFETVESSKFFSEIHKDLIIIMLISNACKLDMKSFVNTAFMSSTMNLVVNTMNYVNVCQLFKISEDVYNMFVDQVYESNLFLQNGKWFTALEYYNGNNELSAALALKSKEFDKVTRANVKDIIDLHETVNRYLDDLYTELESMAASGKPLMILNKGENVDAENLVTDFEPFTIINYLKDFLEVT